MVHKRSALDMMLTVGSGMGEGVLIVDDKKAKYALDDSLNPRPSVGRFGPSAPHENQSPVVYQIDYAPTKTWRGEHEGECIPDTWMPRYDANNVHLMRRGMVIIRCASQERGGSRGFQGKPPRGTLYLNCLRDGYNFSFGGIVGNPSRQSDGPALSTGDFFGTAEYGGGELTTFHNSPIQARSGQTLYCSVVPIVYRREGEVVSNRYKFDRSFPLDERGYQQLLMPSVIALDAENVEHLQTGPLFELEDQLQTLLQHNKMISSANNEQIDKFSSQTLDKTIKENGYKLIPPLPSWLRISVLRSGLETAYVRWRGAVKPSTNYANAVKTLHAQLLAAVDLFFRDQRTQVLRKYGSETGTMAMGSARRTHPESMMSLTQLKSDQDQIKEENIYKTDLLVLNLLKLSHKVLATLHNMMVAWLAAMRMGVVTTPVARPGEQVKYIKT